MKDKFKTLVWKDALRPEGFGMYAHPVKLTSEYEWGLSEAPLLLSESTTFDDLKAIYPGLALDAVLLVHVKLEITL